MATPGSLQNCKRIGNIHSESHYADLLKKQRVIKLLAARDGDLKQRFREHIDRRVDEKYPPNLFDIPDGAVPETIRCQALEAMATRTVAAEKDSSE